MNINELNVSKLSLMQVNIGTVELILLSQLRSLSNTPFQFILLVQLLNFLKLSFTNKKFHCFSSEMNS